MIIKRGILVLSSIVAGIITSPLLYIATTSTLERLFEGNILQFFVGLILMLFFLIPLISFLISITLNYEADASETVSVITFASCIVLALFGLIYILFKAVAV